MTPTVGRSVHYVMKDGQVRPAQVVRVWNETCVNLVVTVDGSNDRDNFPNGAPVPVVTRWTDGQGNPHDCEQVPLQVWQTSVVQGDGPGQWKWPERVPG